MEKETTLAKRQLNLEWRGGNTTVIKYCIDQEGLRKVLSEGLYQAIKMQSKDTSEENVTQMIRDVLEDFQYEPLEVITMAITDIRKGKRKIYGMVTPFDLREMITNNLELIAIQREREHNERKGHAEVEVSKRHSGRISDHFKIEKK